MKRHIATLLVAFALMGAHIPIVSAVPIVPHGIELSFNSPTREYLIGDVMIFTLTGPDVLSARARVDSQELTLHNAGFGWVALFPISLDTRVGAHYLEVRARLNSGELVVYRLPVWFLRRTFYRQDVVIPGGLGYLLDPLLDQGELARLEAIYSVESPQRYWSGNFILPVEGGEPTSAFGAYRSYNGGAFTGRHTGQDIRAPFGTQVLAAGRGRVAFADFMDVRGNIVIIDHGWGLFTAYCHLSEIEVEAGQIVEQGQVIGFSGSTGRSSSAHLHWEAAVNGVWVDPMGLLSLYLP